jgi:hypothetical protein
MRMWGRHLYGYAAQGPRRVSGAVCLRRDLLSTPPWEARREAGNPENGADYRRGAVGVKGIVE